MPASHGLRPNDDEGASPARPHSKQGYPESPIRRGEPRTSLPLDIGGERLAEGQLDDGLFSTRAEKRRKRGDEDRRVGDEDPSH
jgi:hypothetical protein